MKKSNKHLINMVLEEFDAGEKSVREICSENGISRSHYTFGSKNTAYRNQRNPKNLLHITTYQN